MRARENNAEDIFTKKGRGYKKIAETFSGFPDEGMYIVFDGTLNQFTKISEVPLFNTISCEFEKKELSSFLIECSKRNACSLNDLIMLVFEFIYNKHNDRDINLVKKSLTKRNNIIENKLYFKKGSRYHSVDSYSFVGFPSDGLWICHEGRNSLLLSDELLRCLPFNIIEYVQSIDLFYCILKDTKCDLESICDIASIFFDHPDAKKIQIKNHNISENEKRKIFLAGFDSFL